MAKELCIDIQEPWLSAIARGEKTVEGRLCKGKFADLKHGTRLLISGVVRAIVLSTYLYESFEEYLTVEGVSRALPGVHSVSEGIQIYRAFYAEDAEREYGVLAVRIALSDEF